MKETEFFIEEGHPYFLLSCVIVDLLEDAMEHSGVDYFARRVFSAEKCKEATCRSLVPLPSGSFSINLHATPNHYGYEEVRDIYFDGKLVYQETFTPGADEGYGLVKYEQGLWTETLRELCRSEAPRTRLPVGSLFEQLLLDKDLPAGRLFER